MLCSSVRVSWVGITIILAVTSVAGVAYSRSGGITGKSGKQSGSCNDCHGGGVAPKVKLDGPTSLDAGALAAYTFRMETDAAATGMNAAVSASDGIMAGDPDGGATREDDNEIVHARIVRPSDAGEVIYAFSMKAPPFGGKITLFAAGNACNNNGGTDGDESARTSIEIEVNGPPRPPPPEAGPPVKPPEQPAVDASPPASNSDAGAKTGAAPEDDAGCSIGWADHSSLPAGATLASLVALAAIGRSRRRREHPCGHRTAPG